MLRGRDDHPCMCFIKEVLNRCIRLGAYEDFVELVPEEFSSLIPPEPTFQFKYSANVDCECRECDKVDVSGCFPFSSHP